MALLGVDVGTTFCKCALFEDDGTLLRPARRPTPTRHTPDGLPFYDPDGLWALVASAIREVVAGGGSRVSAVGVSSMAEAGLLVDAGTGEPRSHIIPWYDSRSAEQAEAVGRLEDPLA
ncbi:MAG TPA: FGGY family carbohydrate kinase, partial [Chloroflexota bacterium]